MQDNQTLLEFDDSLDSLYRRHDGGQDPRKGVIRAADYADFDSIPDPDAAALLVYLDIFRGIPLGNDVFAFGPDRLLSRSAFYRMLERTKGTAGEEVRKIGRSRDGICYAEALGLVNAALGSAQLPPAHPSDLQLNRSIAAELLSGALRASRGDGAIPFLYYISKPLELQELELPANSVIASPDGTLATLTVDGTFQPITGGYHYTGRLKISLTDRYELFRYVTAPAKPGAMPDEPSDLPPEPCYWNYFDEPYRAALFIENGEKRPERSVDAAYNILDDGTICLLSSDAPDNSYGANNFNGIIVTGQNARYDIDRLRIRFNGNGMDDFQGMGAGLLICGDGTEAVISGADIDNYGTVRSAMVVGGSARVLVLNSRFQAHEGFFEEGWIGGMGAKKMRSAPIWGGFEGNCRCTNLLDQAETTYIDSQILSEKWGVLSTDNNKGCHCTAVNSLVAITGGLNSAIDTSSEAAARKSLSRLPFSEIYGTLQRDMGTHPYASHMHPGGYGTYSIGNTTVKFAGSTVIAADYANTCVNAAAKVIYCASTPENLAGVYGADQVEITPQNTVVYCDKVGVMMQRGNGNGGVEIKDGTIFHCGMTCFSVKANGSFHIDADRSALISESGTILQVMDDDDKPDLIADPPSPSEEELENARQLTAEGLLQPYTAVPGRDIFVHFSNMEINGNCYNGSGYTGAIKREDFSAEPAEGGFNPFQIRPKDSVRNLELKLENVQYSGIISTSEGHHIDRDTGRWLSPVPQEKWYNLAFLEHIPKPAYQAGLILQLLDHSIWRVTQTSYLTSLTLDETSSIHGAVYVNGSLRIPKPGEVYTGNIIVQPCIAAEYPS